MLIISIYVYWTVYRMNYLSYRCLNLRIKSHCSIICWYFPYVRQCDIMKRGVTVNDTVSMYWLKVKKRKSYDIMIQDLKLSKCNAVTCSVLSICCCLYHILLLWFMTKKVILGTNIGNEIKIKALNPCHTRVASLQRSHSVLTNVDRWGVLCAVATNAVCALHARCAIA